MQQYLICKSQIKCEAVTLDPHAHAVAHMGTHCVFSFIFSCKLTLIEFFHRKIIDI